MFSWTPQAIEQLKALAAENLSTREIANAIGTSRNAVIGKCHREKIQLRPQGGSKPKAPRVRRVRASGFRVFKLRLAPFIPEAAPMPVEPLNIPFMQLQKHQCREVVGKGDDGLATYCGHQKHGASSYCCWHSAENETPPPRARPNGLFRYGSRAA